MKKSEKRQSTITVRNPKADLKTRKITFSLSLTPIEWARFNVHYYGHSPATLCIPYLTERARWITGWEEMGLSRTENRLVRLMNALRGLVGNHRSFPSNPGMVGAWFNEIGQKLVAKKNLKRATMLSIEINGGARWINFLRTYYPSARAA